jgi:hypothetical protein
MTSIGSRSLLWTLLVCAALLLPSAGRAAGGRYAFTGGTPRERAQVVRALQASSFDWELVSDQVRVHIGRGILSRATPGQVWLDANLLDAGAFAWGVVQHEFAHQVDFLLLTSSDRDALRGVVGGRVWCTPGLHSADQGCERFASALAWAYWPSPENCMRPDAETRQAAARFRTRLEQLIPFAQRTAR